MDTIQSPNAVIPGKYRTLTRTFASHSVSMAIVFALAVIQTACSDESTRKEQSIVGTWDLKVDWGKGEKALGRHIVTVKSDLTGTIRNVNQGWTTNLRNVTDENGRVRFSFFFGEKRDYDIKFDGTVAEKQIKGKFHALGATAIVRGMPLTSKEAKAFFGKPSPADSYEARVFKSSDGDTLPYRLFIPSDYAPDRKYPIVLFHHGGGGAGSDNKGQLESACVREWIRPEAQKINPCFIVAPQIPGKKSKGTSDSTSPIEVMNRRIRTIHQILDSLEKEFSIDKNREYVTGLSFGGECTWLSIIERPERFAAAIPICAGNRLIEMPVTERGRKFARFPLWIFHGDADKVISVDASREITETLRQAGGRPKYTEYAGVNHYCWDKAYRDPKLISWLFAQSRISVPR